MNSAMLGGSDRRSAPAPITQRVPHDGARPGAAHAPARRLRRAAVAAFALAFFALTGEAKGAVLISSLEHGAPYLLEPDSAKIAFGIKTGRNRLGYVLKSVDIAYQDAEADRFSAELCGAVITEHLPGVDFGDPTDNRVRRYEPTTTCLPLTAPVASAFSAGTTNRTTLTFRADQIGGLPLKPSTFYALVLTPAPGKTVTYVATNDRIPHTRESAAWVYGASYIRETSGGSWSWGTTDPERFPSVLRVRFNGRKVASKFIDRLDITHDGKIIPFDHRQGGFLGNTHWPTYYLTVGNDVDDLKVDPSEDFDIEYLDGDDEPITDTDTSTHALDVDLPVGKTLIKVRVTNVISSRTGGSRTIIKTYTLHVRRVAGAPDGTCSVIWCSNWTFGTSHNSSFKG